MNEKQCTGCNLTLELSSFTSQKRGLFGRRSRCKACVSKKYKEYYSNRWANDRVFRFKKIQQSTEWARKNPEKRSVIAKRRNQKALAQNPSAVNCRALVNQRVRFGRMPKACSQSCVKCGSQAAHYHHYNGYEFAHRYDVEPVCAPCHKLLG